MIDTLTRSPFTADTVIEAAREQIRQQAGWVGYSGETITGSETADYLDALQAALEKRGWVPTAEDGPQMPDLDESMPVKAMIVTLWRYARETLAPNRGPLTLFDARAEMYGQDVDVVAFRVLDELVAAHTGVRTAQATAWVGRKGRTWDEVRDLLTAAADFAREHGPR